MPKAPGRLAKGFLIMDTTKSGYVYVLQMDGHPYYKIGRTVNISRRFGQISPQMPGRLIVVMAHRVDDAWRTESFLHDDFHWKRMNGEWFRLNEEDLREIRAHLLADQGCRLYQRLLATITADVHFMLSHARLTRALYRATLRMDRRFAAYFDRACCRPAETPPMAIELSDPVLGAEVIG